MDIRYFGALLPVEESVLFAGIEVPVTLRVLDNEDELAVMAENAAFTGEERAYREVLSRLARALVSVRGTLVVEELEQRLAWSQTWPEPLTPLLAEAYERARRRIQVERQKLESDPNPPALSAVESGGDSGPGTSSGH